MIRYWHRFTTGHWYDAWPVFVNLDGEGGIGWFECRVCLMDAYREEAREQGTIGGNRWPS